MEIEKQMKEIAKQAGASEDQVVQAMKLTSSVLEKKNDVEGLILNWEFG